MGHGRLAHRSNRPKSDQLDFVAPTPNWFVCCETGSKNFGADEGKGAASQTIQFDLAHLFFPPLHRGEAHSQRHEKTSNLGKMSERETAKAL